MVVGFETRFQGRGPGNPMTTRDLAQSYLMKARSRLKLLTDARLVFAAAARLITPPAEDPA